MSKYQPSLRGWCDGGGQYSPHRSKKEQLLSYLLLGYVKNKEELNRRNLTIYL